MNCSPRVGVEQIPMKEFRARGANKEYFTPENIYISGEQKKLTIGKLLYKKEILNTPK